MVGRIQSYIDNELHIGRVRFSSSTGELQNDNVIIADNYLLFRGKAYSINSNSRFFFEELRENDIVAINPFGVITRIYECESNDATLVVTNHCNSNCIMCPVSEATRRSKDTNEMNILMKYIDLLPDDVGHFCITGGEPTLLKDGLIDIFDACSHRFQNTDFQLLTNGRSFSNISFCERCVKSMPFNCEIDVPLHSASQYLHDSITQSVGSFDQTITGIHNLLKLNQRVEIRVVVTLLNCKTLIDLAQFILDNYSKCMRVTFIGLELHGNAAKNKDRIWLDYKDAFRFVQPAVDFLYKNGIDVYLYNFPLCTVEKRYWCLCKQSITPSKIRFFTKCNECNVKECCSGFFVSSMNMAQLYADPVVR